MEFSADQRKFLTLLAARIPKLFDAIRQGNVKSEYIIGVRRIGNNNVRLKLVAEVVDTGANPLATHSTGNDHSSEPKVPTGMPGSSPVADRSSYRQTASELPASVRRRPRKR